MRHRKNRFLVAVSLTLVAWGAIQISGDNLFPTDSAVTVVATENETDPKGDTGWG
jgi:hypothetical protein